MLSATQTRQYLHRLGLPGHPAPSVAGLSALHRAHVEHVPYETLEIQLGRPTTVDPVESADRILRGRGGYCYHLNGAFAALLTTLGYEVTWHVAGLQPDPSTPAGANGNHLALTVRCEGGTWFADVGLADALHEPMPLREGTYRQGPMTFGLRRSAAEPEGWRFDHDPRGSFTGMDFRTGPAGPADFTERHQYLSTSPDSPFAGTALVFRRDAAGVDTLHGCVLSRTDANGRHRSELTTAEAWFAVLGSRFGLSLDDLGPADRDALWHKVHAAHLAWRTSAAQAS
ncbi:arylamine N-acetyltransferase [Streptomyces sp. NPDC047108]|uniref:arylamine N-acetyltransferase family protein n=1 Tax=Streptomyces sp. NPDC047108 TaxID=3155025 RepID=UPI0033E4E9F2